VANPEGINQQASLAPGYGEITKLHALEKSVPIEANPALNAPQRNQRQATRPQKSTAENPNPQDHVFAHAPQTQISPEVQAALLWQQIAQIPGASQQVIDIAQRATREAGL
jgi:hypothetical protein